MLFRSVLVFLSACSFAASMRTHVDDLGTLDKFSGRPSVTEGYSHLLTENQDDDQGDDRMDDQEDLEMARQRRGSRPLEEETKVGTTRFITRAFQRFGLAAATIVAIGGTAASKGSTNGPPTLRGLGEDNVMAMFCPTAEDMNFEYGQVDWTQGGWEMTGKARVSSKTTFNLLGGYIEFDMDVSGANPGVGSNLYTVSQQGDNCGKDCHCGIQGKGSPACMELDITQNNGKCKMQTALHTVSGNDDGKNGCDAGGCATTRDLPGGGRVHFKSVWHENGHWVTYMDGQALNPGHVTDNDRKIVMDTMLRRGAAVQSSQWKGWVPGSDCPGGGNLDTSVFSVSNLKVYGKVHHGPAPTKCKITESKQVDTPEADASSHSSSPSWSGEGKLAAKVIGDAGMKVLGGEDEAQPSVSQILSKTLIESLFTYEGWKRPKIHTKHADVTSPERGP